MSEARFEIKHVQGHSEQRTVGAGDYTIGRHESNHIVLGDENVSGHHALIEVRDEGVKISDTNSRNGVIDARGARIGVASPMRIDEIVTIGRSAIILRSFVGAYKPTVAFSTVEQGMIGLQPREQPAARQGDAGSRTKAREGVAPAGVDLASVFISHAAEDAVLALELVKALESAGFSTWCYELDTGARGVSHLDWSTRGIQSSDAFVLLISSKSLASAEVTDELSCAVRFNKPVIPLLHHITFEQVTGRPEWASRIGTRAALDVGEPEAIGKLLTSLSSHGVGRRRHAAAREDRLKLVSKELAQRGHRSGPFRVRPSAPNKIGENTFRFFNVADRLDDVCACLEHLFARQSLEVQSFRDGQVRVIQARTRSGKSLLSHWRKGLGLERAVTVKIQPEGYHLLLEVGGGSWVDKAVGGAVGAILFPPAIAFTAWGAHQQTKLLERIPRDIDEFLKVETAHRS